MLLCFPEKYNKETAVEVINRNKCMLAEKRDLFSGYFWGITITIDTIILIFIVDIMIVIHKYI